MFVVLLLNHPFKEDVSMAVWQYDSESMRSLSYARMQVDETCRDMPETATGLVDGRRARWSDAPHALAELQWRCAG